MRPDLRLPARRAVRRAAASVELALLLPLILILLLGIWEVGRMIEMQQLLTNAAREGGRQASTGNLTNAQTAQVVRDYLVNAGVPTTNVTVTVANVTSAGTDVSAAAQLDQLSVTVTLPCADVRWVALNYLITPIGTLTYKSVWCSVKDKDYPSPQDPPIDY